MGKKILLGVLLIVALIATAIPVYAAVPIFKDFRVNYESPTMCQAGMKANVTVYIELNTSDVPRVYQIRIAFPPEFNISNASVTYIDRDGTNITNYIKKQDVVTTDTGSYIYVVVNDPISSQTLPAGTKFNLTITNVINPETAGNYFVTGSIWDESGSTQYERKTDILTVCGIPIPPGTNVLPCCEDCVYKYTNGMIMRAIPEGCFRIEVNYSNYELKGGKLYIDDTVYDEYFNLIKWDESYSKPCYAFGDELEDLSVLVPYCPEVKPGDNWVYDPDASNATTCCFKCKSEYIIPLSNNWQLDDDDDYNPWEYGQPIDIISYCRKPLGNVWGITMGGNYTNNSDGSLITPAVDINCGEKYTGDVQVKFSYIAFFGAGDYVNVTVQYYNGNNWIDAKTFTLNTTTECYGGEFNEVVSVSDALKIRLKFDFKSNASDVWYGFYITEDITIELKDDTASTCKKPNRWVSPCLCLSMITKIPLDGEHSVRFRSIWYDSQQDKYFYDDSNELRFVFDNTGPEIEYAGNTSDSWVFNVTDAGSGVSTSSNIEVKFYGNETPHWTFFNTQYLSEEGTMVLVYEYTILSNGYDSVSIHFSNIEMGDYDELAVTEGCNNIPIFTYYRCTAGYYVPFASILDNGKSFTPILVEYGYVNETGYPGGTTIEGCCLHSAWVRVPFNKCESECSCHNVCEGQCIECDFAQIKYADFAGDSQYGIKVDMIVYGEGIKVFVNGTDVTDEVTITGSGSTVQVKVPKSVAPEGSQITIVATDNVGNANALKTTVGGGQYVPPQQGTQPSTIEQTIHKYYAGADVSNKNDVLQAIINAINAYFSATSEERPGILNDIIEMINYYFTL